MSDAVYLNENKLLETGKMSKVKLNSEINQKYKLLNYFVVLAIKSNRKRLNSNRILWLREKKHFILGINNFWNRS